MGTSMDSDFRENPHGWRTIGGATLLEQVLLGYYCSNTGNKGETWYSRNLGGIRLLHHGKSFYLEQDSGGKDVTTLQTELISICVPVYNGEHFLEESLRSIMTQTYDRIEIIVSDNCSSDATAEIVRHLRMEDERIRYSRNESNIGYSRNVMQAVRRSRGEYVAIYHADDVYDPGIVRAEYEVLKSHPEVGGVFSLLTEFTERPELGRMPKVYRDLQKTRLFDRETNTIEGDFPDFARLLGRNGNFFACPSFMTRRRLYMSIGGFTDKYPTNEDLELWLKYLQLGWRLSIINQPLLHYRRTDFQVSALVRMTPKLNNMFSVLEDIVINAGVLGRYSQNAFLRMKAHQLRLEADKAHQIGKRRIATNLMSEAERCLPPRLYSRIIYRFPISYFLYRQIRRAAKRLLLRLGV